MEGRFSIFFFVWYNVKGMMKIDIKTTNIRLNDPLRRYITEKIGSLDKFIRGGRAWVEIGRPSEHHRKGPEIFYAEANVQLPFKGRVIRSESSKEDLRLAIDEVKDELQRELKKYKEIRETKQRKGARMFKRLLHFSPLSWYRGRKKD